MYRVAMYYQELQSKSGSYGFCGLSVLGLFVGFRHTFVLCGGSRSLHRAMCSQRRVALELLCVVFVRRLCFRM